MQKGIDYLGCGNDEKYRDRIVKYHAEGFAAGFLFRASGWKNPQDTVRALLETDKCPTVRVHGVWLDSHNFEAKHIGPAVAQARKVAKLQEEFPAVKFFFSPWLEHRASYSLFKTCKKECKNVLPSKVKLVSSGAFTGKGIQEYHHTLTSDRKPIFSFDGEDMTKITVSDMQSYKAWYRGLDAHLFMYWDYVFNRKKFLYDPTLRKDRVKVPRKKDFLEAFTRLGV